MKKMIQKGIYLVVDPAMDKNCLLSRLQQAVEQPIVAVQVWDNLENVEHVNELLASVIGICKQANVPILINNRWELVATMDFDGVHFDSIPENIDLIKSKTGRKIITGITCNNDLSVVQWADDHALNYISFCSMFPSSTANSCELVSFETVRQARLITSLPIFLAGGIRPGNIRALKELDYSGIAVVSGVMSANNPAEAINLYHEKLNQSLL
ncbi:MAG: thiamine phosphate synthase [Agriterribacter sp.]